MAEKSNEHKIIIENLNAAIRGKKTYANILKRLNEKKMRKINDWRSTVLLFPSHDDEINLHGIVYLEEFLFRANLSRFVVITTDEKVFEAITKIYPDNKDVYMINDLEMRDILMFYRLYPFDNRLRIISLEEPLGRRASNLLGIKGITKEMLIAVGIYELIPFEKKKIERNNGVILSIFDKEIDV